MIKKFLSNLKKAFFHPNYIPTPPVVSNSNIHSAELNEKNINIAIREMKKTASKSGKRINRIPQNAVSVKSAERLKYMDFIVVIDGLAYRATKENIKDRQLMMAINETEKGEWAFLI